MTADKDLRLFAATWNEEWLWMYTRRTSGGANVLGLDVYYDTDLSDLLTNTDQVLVVGWSGSNGKYDTSTYNYSAFNVSGDPITGDGVTEPGTITNPVGLEIGVLGGSDAGIELEYRVRWSELGVPACSPVVAHISTSRGSGTNIPSQVEDNAARFDTRIYDLSFYDDSVKSGKQGNTVIHGHTILNLGNLPDLYNLNVTGTLPGYTTTLYYANGTLLTDTDGDGRIDTGYLLPNYGVKIYMNVTIPFSAISGDVDVTTITAYSKYKNTTNKSVVDTTIVGAIAVIPNNKGFAVKDSIIEYDHNIYNNDVTTTVNVNYSSSQGYTVTLHYQNGTQLSDTNGDTMPDVGIVISGFYAPLKVRVQIPSSATIGTIDNTTVTAFTVFGESGTAYDKTTASERISITPNITTAGGIGSSVYLLHYITYVSNTSDVVDINYSQVEGWAVEFFYEDYTTPLTDTNSNSLIDAGLFGINGDMKTIVVKLHVPYDATINTTELIYYNVTGNDYPDIGSAMDNISAQQLVSYRDSSFTFQEYYFKQTETVYSRAYALTMANVYFLFIDPISTIVRQSPYIPVDELDMADDSYYLNSTELSGRWDLVVLNKQGDAEIARINFYVNVPPVILNISDYPDPVYQGQTVNFTANITAGELKWFPNESVVLGAYLELGGVNYSMVRPNISTGIGEYYFDTLNTSNVSPGIYPYKIYAYDNFTYYNVSIPATGTIEIRAVNFTNVSGVVTDSRYNVVPCNISIYNSTGHLIISEDEYYNFTLYRSVPYNITIVPQNGSLKRITYSNAIFPPQLLNFTRLEDTLENDTDKPDEIYNWTESIAWWTDPFLYYSETVLNFTYGNDTGLYFWKCTDWNFDNRSCNNNSFVITQNLSNGPAWAEVHLSPGDPGAGAGRAPDYNESLLVWDVTGLNETGRRDNGTFVGQFYDLEDVNVTIGKAYRFEVFVTQTVERTAGILRDPYYDNIQDAYTVDMTGLDAPNITVINGTVYIDPITPTIVSGTEAGTQKLIWDSPPPNKTVSDLDANDTVKLWFVIDVLSNATNESHLGHFVGKSKGQDAELTNNITTLIGYPPYPPNLTYPNNGNDTLINRTITFIWEPAYDPDNQTLTYSINITSEFCSDIYDTNISATNYTPIYELGTYDECGTYNWTVRAYDGYYYGNWSESWNFSIMPYVALVLLNNTVDFGEAEINIWNDTTDDNPLPFLLQSDGNVLTNVMNVTANQSFFIGQSTVDSDFQIKADNSTFGSWFNWTGSAFDWINLTT
ncbi:hypothetical protein KY363_07365 [Candidatus Woesearchaeota archaeon]|nr:hypothetical protein [Candidatus Woesearchaeota archaeon]